MFNTNFGEEYGGHNLAPVRDQSRGSAVKNSSIIFSKKQPSLKSRLENIIEELNFDGEENDVINRLIQNIEEEIPINITDEDEAAIVKTTLDQFVETMVKDYEFKKWKQKNGSTY